MELCPHDKPISQSCKYCHRVKDDGGAEEARKHIKRQRGRSSDAAVKRASQILAQHWRINGQYVTRIAQSSDGDYFIRIPRQFLGKLDWAANELVDICVIDKKLVVRRAGFESPEE